MCLVSENLFKLNYFLATVRFDFPFVSLRGSLGVCVWGRGSLCGAGAGTGAVAQHHAPKV